MDERHDILMAYTLRRHPDLRLKDRQRGFTMEQKIAIWYRADGKCEWGTDDGRCEKTFRNPREADADHIVKWADGGPTTLTNGRLLCVEHNRAPRA
jgi:hypothetical protein